MSSYYVNNTAQQNGDHEVHKEGCSFMPYSKVYLGEHQTCITAVKKAKEYYLQSNGCYFCANFCHTS